MRTAARRATNLPALTHMQSGLLSVDWSGERSVVDDDGWKLYLDGSLQRWEVYVDVENQRTFVSRDTWETIAGHGPARTVFLAQYVWTSMGGTGMRFVVSDAGPYAEAARKQAEAAGTATPAAKDRLRALNEQARSFVVQAASLNTMATPGQASTFALRYARLRAELADLERELEVARGLVDLAGSALVDATLPSPAPM